MRRLSFFLPALFLIVSALYSMEWPSQTGTTTGNFGWNDSGFPRLGVSFEDADGGTIVAAEAGELLYRRKEDDTASRLPSPLGSWTALDHGDGIISIYGRSDDKPAPAAPEGRIERGGTLGEAGISGWSSQRGFYFQLFDRKERRWINPSLIITPREDTVPPVIARITLRDAQGRFFNLSETRNISQGRYVVFVDAVDSAGNSDGSPLAPHRIICTLNGSEAGGLSFETYSARNGALVVYRNGLIPARQLYAQVPGYEVADVWFTRGQATLEIIAQDFAGNARSVISRLTVE